MAKGLRSKSMRKNRTMLRKTLSEPIQKNRQELLAKKLMEELRAKTSSQTLTGLRQVLAPRSANNADRMDEEEDDEEEEEEPEEKQVSTTAKSKTIKASGRTQPEEVVKKGKKSKGK